jgi:hypothetical protein
MIIVEVTAIDEKLIVVKKLRGSTIVIVGG